jgi:hypothetical protein
MKKSAVRVLALSIILGTFLRLYRLNTNYVWFNDTFFRLTPALEILKGVPVNFDSSMMGVTGLGILCFSIYENLYSVVLAVCIVGIICIPLSYYFVLRLTKDEKMAALVSLFVSINPTLIALSKVLLWDVFVLFFFLVSGIIFISFKEKEGLLKGVLLAFSLFLLFTFKLPNVLYAAIFYFFLFHSNKFSIKKSKNVMASLSFFLLLMGIFFYLFPDALRPFVKGGGENFFLREEYLPLVMATLKLLLSPLASPATSMAFSSDMGITFFFIIGLVSLIPIIFYFKDVKKIEDLLSISFVLIISLFFINYGGWSHRYLIVPMFLMLFFTSYGIVKINEKRRIFAVFILALCFVSSFGSSIRMVDDWSSDKSLVANHIATPLSLFNKAVELAKNENVDTITSPYGRVFTFYYLSGSLESEVIDFNLLEESAVEKRMNDTVALGKKVWYVEGWPDVFVFGGKNTMAYKKMIENDFLLKTFYISKEEIYVSEEKYPSLIIYLIEKEK